MTARPLRLLLLLAVALAAGHRPARAEDPARPDMLFILTDDHAVQAISAYGSPLDDTPHIDRRRPHGSLGGKTPHERLRSRL